VEEGVLTAVLQEQGLAFALADNDQKVAAQAVTKECMMACAFLQDAERGKYGKLLEDLENAYTQGEDWYPRNLRDVHKLLANWKQDPRNVQVVRQGGGPGGTATGNEVAFANMGLDDDKAGVVMTNTSGRHPNTRCFRCQRFGHYALDCNEERAGGEDAVQLFMAGVAEADDEEYSGFAFANMGTNRAGLPKTWILLDNQSMVNMFCNKSLLTGVKPTNKWMNVHCNAGTTRTNLVGKLVGFPGDVWYHPNGIVNILLMTEVEKYFPVTYGQDKRFVIHKPDGTTRSFIKSVGGLHYMDTATMEDEAAFINTVADKKSNYTVKEYRKALLASRTQHIIGRPSLKDYVRYSDSLQLTNCPLGRENIAAAEDIFGPNLGSLRGKTVHRNGTTIDIAPRFIPPEIMDRHRDVTIAMDIMFVNKLAFLVNISIGIKFGTVEFLVSRGHDNILAAVKRIKNIYAKQGFNVTHCKADLEFKPLRTDLDGEGIHLNAVAEDEHVPEIERQI